MENVNLNLTGLNFQKPLTPKEEDKKPQLDEKGEKAPEQKAVDNDQMLKAMALSGAQNKVLVSGIGSLPNPKDYLDDASIARIQGSVVEFQSAVEKYSKAIDKELGDTVSEADKNSIALSMVNGLI